MVRSIVATVLYWHYTFFISNATHELLYEERL